MWIGVNFLFTHLNKVLSKTIYWIYRSIQISTMNLRIIPHLINCSKSITKYQVKYNTKISSNSINSLRHGTQLISWCASSSDLSFSLSFSPWNYNQQWGRNSNRLGCVDWSRTGQQIQPCKLNTCRVWSASVLYEAKAWKAWWSQ